MDSPVLFLFHQLQPEKVNIKIGVKTKNNTKKFTLIVNELSLNDLAFIILKL